MTDEELIKMFEDLVEGQRKIMKSLDAMIEKLEAEIRRCER